MAEVTGLALGIANLYFITGAKIRGFERRFASDTHDNSLQTLNQKVQEVEQSLRVIGELLSTTKDVSETDLDLSIQTYLAATAQITLLKRRVTFFVLPVNQSVYATFADTTLSEIDAIAVNAEILRRILTIAYWDGVEPTPVAQHSTLDKELMSSPAYRAEFSRKHFRLNGKLELLRVSEDEESINVDDPISSSAAYHACSASNNEHLTNIHLLESRPPSRLSVDEAFGLVGAERDREPSLTTEDYKSTSSSYLSGSNILTGPGKAPHMYMKIFMRDRLGIDHELNCLLDTGATVDCISKNQAKLLEPRSAGLIRRSKSPLELQAANGDMIESELLFKGTWNFVNRDTGYTQLFHLIDGLPTDVLISRETIFQYGFLVQNPDLLPLGLSNATSTVPGLNVLGLAKISKDQQQRQDQSKLKKALENKEEREKQLRELSARLDQLKKQDQGSPGLNQGSSSSTQ